MLPNSAGCYNAEDAVRTLRLARELLDGHALTKLEVLGDPQSLYPNMPETLKAAETLVKEGFEVMVYCSDDPIQARVLESIGCVAVMPLASLIGSGMGILNPWNIQLILERARVPVIVDAGVGTASDAAIAMELGCDGVLMNTAIAQAQDPVLMASAMKKAVEAGREAYRAGRMPKRLYSGSPSSPSRGRDRAVQARHVSTRSSAPTSRPAAESAGPPLRHIRSFALRRGHVTQGQRRAFDELLPRYGVPYAAAAARLCAALRTEPRPRCSRSASAWARRRRRSPRAVPTSTSSASKCSSRASAHC